MEQDLPVSVTYDDHQMSHVTCNGSVHFFLGWRLNQFRDILLLGEKGIRASLRDPRMFLYNVNL